MDIHFIAPLILFPIIDYFYLSSIGISLFAPAIANIQGSPLKFNFFYALAAYSFLILGLYLFVLHNIDPSKKWSTQLLNAFLFGIVLYGTYETTNAAIFKNWGLDLVIVDTLWGGILYTIITFIVLLLKKYY